MLLRVRAVHVQERQKLCAADEMQRPPRRCGSARPAAAARAAVGDDNRGRVGAGHILGRGVAEGYYNAHIRAPVAELQACDLSAQMVTSGAHGGDYRRSSFGRPSDIAPSGRLDRVGDSSGRGPDVPPSPLLWIARPGPVSAGAGQARWSGQCRVTTASRYWRRTRAVACCSSKGRGCGMITAGRSAAATSAMALCPAWVTMTSAPQICGHESSLQSFADVPSVVQVMAGRGAGQSWSAPRPFLHRPGAIPLSGRRVRGMQAWPWRGSRGRQSGLPRRHS